MNILTAYMCYSIELCQRRQQIARSLVKTALLPVVILTLDIQTSRAGSATWQASPATGDWNTATNWTAGGPPNSPSDTATFVASNKTAVSLSAAIETNGTTFAAGASPFTISIPGGLTLTISGVGIMNNSGITQNFTATGDSTTSNSLIEFLNGATAGSSTNFTLNGYVYIFFHNTSTAANGTFTLNGYPTGGVIQFRDTSTAANGAFTLNAPADAQFYDGSSATNGTFTLNSDPVVGFVSTINFNNSSTAANGIFTVNGGSLSGAAGSELYINSTATAGHGTFTVNGPGVSGAGGATMFIYGNADAAILIANAGVSGGSSGGSIRMYNTAVGGTARVKVFGAASGTSTDGFLDISAHFPTVTIGSIEGTGTVFLGDNQLTVGSNNLSTNFSGIIADGGAFGGVAGSLAKIGRGKLTLTKGNTYTGGTTISKGTLLVKNKTGSTTGTGVVQINSGTLSGVGKVGGAVTAGNGTTSGAILLPGNSATHPGTLTINNTVTFRSLSTYKCVLQRATTPKASKLSATAVIINANVPFTFVDTGTGTLPTGAVFTVINNTSASAIAGTFSNLSNGLVFASNGNNFQVSYTGGTGNDLTLTVVP